MCAWLMMIGLAAAEPRTESSTRLDFGNDSPAVVLHDGHHLWFVPLNVLDQEDQWWPYSVEGSLIGSDSKNRAYLLYKGGVSAIDITTGQKTTYPTLGMIQDDRVVVREESGYTLMDSGGIHLLLPSGQLSTLPIDSRDYRIVPDPGTNRLCVEETIVDPNSCYANHIQVCTLLETKRSCLRDHGQWDTRIDTSMPDTPVVPAVL